MVRLPHSQFGPAKRSSFARRDSNLALLGAVFAGVVLAFALLLLLAQRIDPDLGSGLRGATADALSPLIAIVRTPIDAGRMVSAKVSDHLAVVRRNRKLSQQVDELTSRASQADILAMELQAMEKLLLLRRPERRLITGAMASANSASSTDRTAIISAGRADGVQPRMPVIASDGLAGRVTDVGRNASRILLLTDADSRVPVKVLRTGWTGLAVGTGGTLLDFQFDIASGTDQIRAGDQLVTSGDGGLFPPGIPVATIIDDEISPPRARPQANPTGLGPVIVEAPWLPTPEFLPVDPAEPEADQPVAPEAPPVESDAA